MIYIFGFAFLLLIVTIIAIRMYPHEVTWQEMAVGAVVQTVVLAVIIYGGYYSQGKDVEILNGSITAKFRDEVSCEHSYSCNCRTTCTSGKNSSCSTTCDTCYEHWSDFNWVVETTVGSFLIDRVNRRGDDMPPRWKNVQMGEPASLPQNYYNYIKAAPFSLFNNMDESEVEVPAYPTVYDYHRINRVINHSSLDIDVKPLNNILNDALKTLGPKKKVNIIVILHTNDVTFSEIVRTKHLGGKINDLYVLIGLNEDMSIKNVATFSWSKSDLVNVTVRDAVADIGQYDTEQVAQAILDNVDKHYEHRSIEEFQYLKHETTLPIWAVALAVIFGLVFPFVSAYVAYRI